MIQNNPKARLLRTKGPTSILQRWASGEVNRRQGLRQIIPGKQFDEGPVGIDTPNLDY